MTFTKIIVVFLILSPFVAATSMPDGPTPSTVIDARPNNCNRPCDLLYTSGDCNRDCIIQRKQKGGASSFSEIMAALKPLQKPISSSQVPRPPSSASSKQEKGQP
ncbi:hypothetical protein POM88_047841 [Heracleum sosnowskyi]|uniref:Uncharacterized protein n=1 Tax=Heracleum sosnowskyi TaxID=360622 RepID=A0AAD8LXX2_9APIA|nr:hypothetical protein POM88_047841 [Heracleum sosnowskyi]